MSASRRCPVCQDAVYFAEEVTQASTSWHRKCFRCQTCSTNLDSSNFAEHKSEEGTELYCRSCHAKAYGTGGYGYGQGAGVLQAGQGTAGTRAQKAQSKQNALGNRFGSTATKCPRCDLSVYHAERIVVTGRDYHRACFRCKTCKRNLESGSHAEHEEEVYCKGCHAKEFGPKGCGFGIGAGALRTS
ncbi:cysteine and glycine-rich protein 1-like [Sycon ciliatum]|uniref:cysteine and glycine-rich protein 1-like n=1 Tax=Sycon ciliatum TaxID=27933 RepID=UPI0020AEA130|eukprot:scpid87303/ scgid18102/ Cysteine and glycine-rich protein 1; Cysteine-rich protein 1; Cysteine and glycine-rich protein 1; Cysteine-rich protein 1